MLLSVANITKSTIVARMLTQNFVLLTPENKKDPCIGIAEVSLMLIAGGQVVFTGESTF